MTSTWRNEPRWKAQALWCGVKPHTTWGSHKHKQCDIIQSDWHQTGPLWDWQVVYSVCMPWTKEWFMLLAASPMRRHLTTPGEHFQHYELLTSKNFHLIFPASSWSYKAEAGNSRGMKSCGLGSLTNIVCHSFSHLSSLCVLGFSVYSTLKGPKRPHRLEFSLNGHLGWLTRCMSFPQ